MRTLTIEIPEPGDEPGTMFDVVDQQGRRANGLCWDEMLAQVAMLTMPANRLGNGFAMRTPKEWSEMRKPRGLPPPPVSESDIPF